MTKEKLTEDMNSETVNTVNTSAAMQETAPAAEKPKKNQKSKHRFALSKELYIWLTIIGIILIGLGCGISVFELSQYKTANYRALPVDPALPPVELYTTTLEAAYEKDAQFKLDAADWNFSKIEIQCNNSLTDKVLMEITAPKDLYNIYLTKSSANHYFLHCDEDMFEAFHYTLELAKDNWVPEYLPPVTVKLIMNEAQAKQFQLNEERYKAQDTEQQYREQLNKVRNEYNEQLNAARSEYTEALNTQRTEYTEQLNQLQEELTQMQEQQGEQISDLQQEHAEQIRSLEKQYNTQLEENATEYERRIAELEMQLEDARSALH